MNKNFVFAVSVLSKTIMGAGIFSLPLVFYMVGVGTGILYLLVFTLAYCVIHLMYAEAVRMEPDEHNFAYLARKYLGSIFGSIATLIILIELLIVLTVYIILSQSFFGIMFGVPGAYAAILFWILGTAFIFVDLKWIEWISVVSVLMLLTAVGIIFHTSIPYAFATPFVKPINWFLFLLPFGPLFFALNGRPAISKMVEVWRNATREKKPFSLTKAIVVGTLLPALLYIVFVLGVLKLSPIPSEDAISGITAVLPAWLMAMLGAFGFVAIWVPYFMIGTNIRDILREDMHLSRIMSAGFVTLIPIGLFLFGVGQFISVVG
ncbi:MAG: aromatic amino acid transport family protein, partial [Patescibacteria group bacterium]